MILSEKQRKDFEEAARPLMHFLANPKLFHPHFTVILSSTHAELVESCMMARTDKYIDEYSSSSGIPGISKKEFAEIKDEENRIVKKEDQVDQKPDCKECEYWFGNGAKFCPDCGKDFAKGGN